jgi:hypothetical protein
LHESTIFSDGYLAESFSDAFSHSCHASSPGDLTGLPPSKGGRADREIEIENTINRKLLIFDTFLIHPLKPEQQTHYSLHT